MWNFLYVCTAVEGNLYIWINLLNAGIFKFTHQIGHIEWFLITEKSLNDKQFQQRRY